MTVEQWMKRVQFIEMELKTLDEMYQEELDKITSITPKLSGMSSSGTTDPHKYDAFAQISYEIDQQRNKLLTAKAEIIEVINTLQDGRYRSILDMRLIQRKRWADIADAIGYCREATERMYKKAIKEIAPEVYKKQSHTVTCDCDILIS